MILWLAYREATALIQFEVTDALDRTHKRAHELTPSKPSEAETLFRQTLEGYRETQGPDGALTLDLTLDRAGMNGRPSTPQHCSAAASWARRSSPRPSR